ncbi:MAG TPA: UvrD-helicase domain-containing protein [Jiangellaceae bacterium]
MTRLADSAARDKIVERLDRTLFVEAGAGSGKTRSLVNRAVATVLDPDDAVPLRHLAIMTFTEKAGAELRDRMRETLEKVVADSPGSHRAALATEALDDLDAAAIGTLHSFAQRILGEHPIEAGLPPLIEVLDEVASGVAFDRRWVSLRAELLDDEELAPTLLLALAANMKLNDLHSMARAFTDNWDLLRDRVLATPLEDLPRLDVAALVHEARRLVELRRHCLDDGDLFVARLDALAEWVDRLDGAPDDPARFTVLTEATRLKWHNGRRANWSYDLESLRSECKKLVEEANALRQRVLDVALRRLAHRIARDVLESAEARREDGRLEFHDLLVMARELLTNQQHGANVRAVLRQRYQRLLLDEFQDTDPIQIELATRIAGGAAASAGNWTDVDVPDGSLFVVGDPKQSIYRFRRADIATYLDAQRRIGDDVALETNFRTTEPVLDWVNHIFGRLITPVDGSQPAYRPLRAHRPAAPAGPPVTVFGTSPHHAKATADEIRGNEAADVVAAVQTAIAERWQVEHEHRLPDGRTEKRWRDVQLDDIAILVPARTSLPHLEDALEAAGIPYRAEASSLVYRTREVRDLLMAARATDDPSDALAVVNALRSPLFGCGDDDLWTWYSAGGRWNILAPVPDAVPDDHPVRSAVGYLKRLHNRRTWLAPSEVLARIVDDRRMLEAAVDGPRGRDVWRRLRFVVDQARAWSSAEHGALRDYLAWAERQADEAARVAEAVLPERDTNTVRIMTIHAAKGLEFPVVIVSGMSSKPFVQRTGVEVLWPPDGGCEFKLRKDLQTAEYELAKPIDEQMGYHERLRLLYVACTRARDHLVVSLHRKQRSRPPADERNRTNAELLASACETAPSQVVLGAAGEAGAARVPAAMVRVVEPPPAYSEWRAAMAAVRSAADRPSAVSASQFEGTFSADAVRPAASDRLGAPDDPGLAKDARDLELPPWNKGRYGTAVGRAVHGVLQSVDLGTGAGMAEAVAAQVLAEGVAEHTDAVGALARSALESDVVRRAAPRPHWRETYVGTVIGDRVLEGFIDLVYEDDDGLVIVDYKTDTVPAAALDRRVAYYRPQVAAYVAGLAAATGRPVARAELLFLSPAGAVERTVDDIDDAIEQLREQVVSR